MKTPGTKKYLYETQQKMKIFLIRSKEVSARCM